MPFDTSVQYIVAIKDESLESESVMGFTPEIIRIARLVRWVLTLPSSVLALAHKETVGVKSRVLPQEFRRMV